MEIETILKTALFSGILGFVFFCASYAFHVWQSRNAAIVAAKRAKRRWFDCLRTWFIVGGVLGCVGLLAAAIWREVRPREGILGGEGLFTVRADASLRLEHITQDKTVRAGDVLARFRSPERQAEIAELTLKRQILEAQKAVVAKHPLLPDAELVRRIQKADDDHRQLVASLLYLIPEHAVVSREKLRDELDRTERINSLNTELDESRRELAQARAQLEKAHRYLKRSEQLSSQNATAPLELDDNATEVSVLETEVLKLESRIADLQNEKKHIEAGLPRFAACTAKQSDTIDGKMAQVRAEIDKTRAERDELSKQLAEDLQRAADLRNRQLEQIDLEIRQCQARLEGIEDVLIIRAPFSGRVAYADPAPRMALPLAPVVVLAQEEGFRFQLRLPEAEVVPLSEASMVPLSLVDPVLHRRFPGRLLQWEPMALEPGYVLADLACSPPPETIRDLASRDWSQHSWVPGRQLRVRLMWRPPLHTSPLFWPAVTAIAVGVGGWVLMSWLAAKRRTQTGSETPDVPTAATHVALEFSSSGRAGLNNESLAATSLPAFDALHMESGANGRNMELLGRRLREAIRRQQVEPELLQAVEWTLDRHHARAVRHLKVGMGSDEQLAQQVAGVFTHLSAPAASGATREGRNGASTSQRLARIIRTISPGLVEGGKYPGLSAGSLEGYDPGDCDPNESHRSTRSARKAIPDNGR